MTMMEAEEVRDFVNDAHDDCRALTSSEYHALIRVIDDHAALKAKVEQVREYLGAVQQPNWSVVRGAIAILDAPPEEATE